MKLFLPKLKRQQIHKQFIVVWGLPVYNGDNTNEGGKMYKTYCKTPGRAAAAKKIKG